MYGQHTDYISGLEPWPMQYIPALLDGTSAADGNPITNPGGFVHNGADVSLVLGSTTNSYADLLAMPYNQTNAAGAVSVVVYEEAAP